MRLLVERTDQTSRCTSRRQLSGVWHTDATGVLPGKSLRHCARDENITIGVRMYAIGLSARIPTVGSAVGIARMVPLVRSEISASDLPRSLLLPAKIMRSGLRPIAIRA